LVEHTNVKGPKDFCDGIKQQAPQIPVQVIEQFTFKPSQKYHQSAVQRHENVVFELNQQYYQPLAYQNEYFVFDPSQQYHQSHAQQSEYPIFDLNLQPSVSTSQVYPDGYQHFYRHPDISTFYVDNDKSPRFDLNELPPNE